MRTGGRQPTGHDQRFQGYSHFLTDSKDRCYFRTIKPNSYTLISVFRTAHVHMAISKNGKRVFTTQLLVKDHPDNARDGVEADRSKSARHGAGDLRPLLDRRSAS